MQQKKYYCNYIKHSKLIYRLAILNITYHLKKEEKIFVNYRKQSWNKKKKEMFMMEKK